MSTSVTFRSTSLVGDSSLQEKRGEDWRSEFTRRNAEDGCWIINTRLHHHFSVDHGTTGNARYTLTYRAPASPLKK